MTVTTKKAPDLSGNSVEGENQNTNHQEGELMNTTVSPDNLSLQTCPRCQGPIEIRGTVKFAARSRTTPERDIEICSPCGLDEALRAYATGLIIPVSGWPVHDPHEYQRPLQDAVNVFCAMNGIEL